MTTKPPSQQLEHSFDANRNECCLTRCFKWFFFTQYISVVHQGYMKPVEEDDTISLPNVEKAAVSTACFQRARDELRASKDKHGWTSQYYLTRSLWRAFGGVWMWSFVWIIGYCITYSLQPLLIRSILRYLENGVVDGMFEGCPPWSLAVMLAVVTQLMSMTMQHGWAQEICGAIALRVALMNTVLIKAMKLSTISRSKTSTGQLITILSVDIDRIFHMVLFLQWLFLCF